LLNNATIPIVVDSLVYIIHYTIDISQSQGWIALNRNSQVRKLTV
jgi:hypothetical protein